MGTYAILAYLMHAKEKADNTITQKMKSELFSDCEKYLNLYKECPYGVSLGDFYPWGSNMLVANNAMMLIFGSLLVIDDNAKKAEYIDAAQEHFHYLLGRNPLSQSYISGFGSNPMKNPHHRPSVAVGAAVPGMVAGGPCGRFDRDEAVNEHCKDAPPSKRYIDHKESFSTNEITIYWNSPVYFMMAALGY
jgi:endoglucanase